MCSKNLLRPKRRSSDLEEVDANLSFLETDISASRAPIQTNKVSISKFTIKEHFESDKPLITAKYTSLDLIKFVCFSGTPDKFQV